MIVLIKMDKRSQALMNLNSIDGKETTNSVYKELKRTTSKKKAQVHVMLEWEIVVAIVLKAVVELLAHITNSRLLKTI